MKRSQLIWMVPITEAQEAHMQYALLIHQDGEFKCEVSVPSAEDAGQVAQHVVEKFPNGLTIQVRPVPHLPDGFALPIDSTPHGAIETINRQFLRES